MSQYHPNQTSLDELLKYLKLHFIRENYEELAKQAVKKQWPHVNYLTELVIAEANLRQDLATQRRIRSARFPQIKTLEQFKWSWPQKINRLQVQNLFRLKFVEDKSNVIFLGGVGLGKTHLATALGWRWSPKTGQCAKLKVRPLNEGGSDNGNETKKAQRRV